MNVLTGSVKRLAVIPSNTRRSTARLFCHLNRESNAGSHVLRQLSSGICDRRSRGRMHWVSPRLARQMATGGSRASDRVQDTTDDGHTPTNSQSSSEKSTGNPSSDHGESAAAAAAAASASHESTLASLIAQVTSMEETVRLHGYQVLRGLLMAAMVLGLSAYFFWDSISGWLAGTTAEITSKSLADEEVLERAELLSKAVLQSVVQDPRTQDQLAEAATRLLCNAAVLAEADRFVRRLLFLQVSDPQSRERLARAAVQLLESEGVRDAAARATIDVMQRADVRAHANDLAVAVMQSPGVVSAANQLGSSVSQRTLADDAVRNQATQLAKSVLDDPDVRHHASEAIYSIVLQAMTPRIISSPSPVKKNSS